MNNTSTVLVTGNTYPVKDSIKALGGRWDAIAKGWRRRPRRSSLARPRAPRVSLARPIAGRHAPVAGRAARVAVERTARAS